MSTLYLDDELQAAAPGDVLALVGAEAKHAIAVSRVRVGEEILIGNGRGLLVTTHVEQTEQGRVTVRALHVEAHERPTRGVELVQALAKGDRDERAVQMCTELGVMSITPWQAERSVSRWDAAKARKGTQRWQTIAREATKQSLRAYVPVVESLTTTADLVQRAGKRILLLDPVADCPLSQLDVDDRPLTVVVGPEGGIAPSEIDALTKAGAERVCLGREVLRTSTAGAAALAVLNVKLGLW